MVPLVAMICEGWRKWMKRCSCILERSSWALHQDKMVLNRPEWACHRHRRPPERHVSYTVSPHPNRMTTSVTHRQRLAMHTSLIMSRHRQNPSGASSMLTCRVESRLLKSVCSICERGEQSDGEMSSSTYYFFFQCPVTGWGRDKTCNWRVHSPFHK